MFCRYCGTEISNDSVFCFKCGKAIENIPINSADSSNANSPQTFKLTVFRESKGTTSLLATIAKMPIDVTIDKQIYTSLQMGESRIFTLSPGPHIVVFSYYIQKKTVKLDLEKDSTLISRITPLASLLEVEIQ